MLPHIWGPSRVGHGEAQCIYCLATNREAMVLFPNDCPSRKEEDKKEEKVKSIDK